jgi:serine/threonine protein kinase/tetratricopeptide (TPR) repeat protein
MNQEFWRRAEDLFHAALKQSAETREAFLDKACDGETELRRYIEELVCKAQQGDGFPDKPLVAEITATLARPRGALIGRELGPYRILSLLGAGGMGEVYLARDSNLCRNVAIKALPEEFARDQHRLARFRHEARTLASLNHPNIAAIYGLEQSEGADYLVLELIEGETPRGPVAIARMLDLTRQVAQALEAAHAKGIIHRDLKPGNIKVTPEGKVKVLDFGLAKTIRGLADRNLSQKASMLAGATLIGSIVGTPAYMSPEQARGRDVDSRSDIWSFGCLMYELLTGRQAFRAETVAETLAAVLDRAPDWQALPPTNSGEVRELLRRCLEKEADCRPATVSEVRRTIEEIAHTLARNAPSFGSVKHLEVQASVAVLPFASLSSDEDNRFFADGLTEEIINALTRVTGLKVAGRTSSFFFRGKDVEIAEIGSRLHVNHILEGSVRKAGNRIRVTAQLIKTDDGFDLWSERYEREMTDIFAIQDQITRGITEVLRMKLSPEAGARSRREPNLRAYEAYLAARSHWFKGTSESQVRFGEYVDRAIALDPEFALPYMLRGGQYSMLAHLGIKPAREVIPLARAAEEEALRLEPLLPEAHALLGVWEGIFSYNWAEAERRWHLAMAREPVSREIRFWYGNHYLLPIGRPLEALEAMAYGLEGDPLNLLYRHHLARGLWHAGRLEEAEAELRKVLDLDKSFPPALETLGAICAQQGRFPEALALTENAFTLMPWANVTAGQLAALLARTGYRSRADELVGALRPGVAYGAATGMMVYHAVCGEFDQAYDWAERAIDERHPELVKILRPLLRTTSGWPVLTKRINLPE